VIKLNKRLLVVWVVLAALTLSYLWIDRSVGGGQRASAAVTSGVIVIAAIKVRIIFREFMEVRQAPALLCRLTDAWVILIAVSLLACYFVGMAIR
jgi:ABC-type transport system involved in Fe-S cluster assembly fused permease/ATPase subunit